MVVVNICLWADLFLYIPKIDKIPFSVISACSFSGPLWAVLWQCGGPSRLAANPVARRHLHGPCCCAEGHPGTCQVPVAQCEPFSCETPGAASSHAALRVVYSPVATHAALLALGGGRETKRPPKPGCCRFRGGWCVLLLLELFQSLIEYGAACHGWSC